MNTSRNCERQLDRVPPFAPDGSVNPYYASLQDRIDAVRVNSTNQLQLLQPRAGVTENAPKIASMLVRGPWVD